MVDHAKLLCVGSDIELSRTVPFSGDRADIELSRTVPFGGADMGQRWRIAIVRIRVGDAGGSPIAIDDSVVSPSSRRPKIV